MTVLMPPEPIWSGPCNAAVWVHEGHIEIDLWNGWSGRLTPTEATDLVNGMAQAVAEASKWVARWDVYTGTYRAEMPSDSSPSLADADTSSVGAHAPGLPPAGVCGPAPDSQHGPGAGHSLSGGAR